MKTIDWAAMLLEASDAVEMGRGFRRYGKLLEWIAARINRRIAREQAMTRMCFEAGPDNPNWTPKCVDCFDGITYDILVAAEKAEHE